MDSRSLTAAVWILVVVTTQLLTKDIEQTLGT
jgi:hypothetical protein